MCLCGPRAVAKQHIVEYDIDCSGCIEEPEFIMCVSSRPRLPITVIRKQNHPLITTYRLQLHGTWSLLRMP
jgi:hypothetical protein